MDSQLELGFKEATSSEIIGEGNYKLVPWISWDDWSFVRESLFSSSPASIDLALRRISAWKSRGCLPVIIEVTASIVEIQQKDSYFRKDLSESDLLADDMLTMLYCMTIIRLVNGIVEKTRKKNEVSIGEAADVIGIPRMLIDIRHECSHRDLPSLRLVRLASTKALDWLKAYYWEPQKMAISHPNTNFGKEIKSKIRELAFCLDVKQTTISSSSSPVVKGKRMKHCEHLCGRSKFLSLMAVKIQSSKTSGSKKHINKALKNVVKLYASFPSEVVSILLEFLLKALESADVALDDWKPLIMKLSNKVPEMLLSLLKANLQMIESRDALEHESGEQIKPDHKSRFQKPEHLSHIFSWLAGNLKDLNRSLRKLPSLESSGTPKEKNLPKSALMDLLRKCLLIPSLSNTHLTTAALILAQTTNNRTLIEKLNKLSSLHNASNTDSFTEIAFPDSNNFYNHEENFIRQAANKLEFIKRKLSQKSKLTIRDNEKIEKNGKWVVMKSWKPCPIGMLPSDFGCSGVVPVLEIVGDLGECDEKREGKREADCPVGDLDDSDVKKVKLSEEVGGVMEGVENRLMIGGVWKRVTYDEVMDMASAVRVLV